MKKGITSAQSSVLEMMLMVFTTSCISGSESVSSVSEDRKGSTSPKSDKREGFALIMKMMMLMMMLMMMMTIETCNISRFPLRFCLQFQPEQMRLLVILLMLMPMLMLIQAGTTCGASSQLIRPRIISS